MDISLGDVKKMSQKDVEKYFVRYQTVLGQRTTGGLAETAIEATTKAASYVLPIDDTNDVAKELHNNDVMIRVSALVGFLALNGGRFVALATAIFIIAKHVKFGGKQQKTNEHPAETQVSEEPTEQHA